MRKKRQPPSAKIQAHRLFFPAASLYAALVIPLSVFAMRSGAWPPGLLDYGHAHEMLFGFALALVAGYTLGPMPKLSLLILLMLWFAARLASIIAPFSLSAGLLNAAFALTLAAFIVPRFMTAKKWRNRIVSPLLLCLCALPVVYALGGHPSIPINRQILLQQSVLLFSLLMIFIGGRIIAPAAAGESERRGLALESRVQPRLEAALIVLLIVASLTLFFPGNRLPAGLLTGIAGIMTAIRLYRWRLWRCRQRPDLIALGVGYGWLAAGLVIYGTSLFLNMWITAALHVITVGALGTLSTGVMLRLHAQHAIRRPPPASIVSVTAALIALSTLSRVAAEPAINKSTPLLWLAAFAWSCAYLLTAAYLLICRKNQR
jgi:uncharacterized protein involved in response to NO